MNTKLDARSLVIGLLAGAALFAAFGATTEPKLGHLVGRYQITSGGIGASFVVDTVTGQVWSGAQQNEFHKPKPKE